MWLTGCASIFFVVIGSSLFTFLLWYNAIDQSHYIALMGLLMLGGFAVYGFRRIRKIDIKALSLTLDKFEQVRDDIYARSGTLNKIADDVAEIATLLATDRIPQLLQVGFYTLGTRYEREASRYELKKRVISILRSTGGDSDRIKAAERQFDERIRKSLKVVLIDNLRGLAEKVLSDRCQEFQKDAASLRNKGVKPSDQEFKDRVSRAQETERECKILKEFITNAALERVFHESNMGIGALAQHLKSKGIWSAAIERHFEELSIFLNKYPIDMKGHDNPS